MATQDVPAKPVHFPTGCVLDFGWCFRWIWHCAKGIIFSINALCRGVGLDDCRRSVFLSCYAGGARFFASINERVIVTSKAGIVDRIYWRCLRLFGFKQKAWDQQFSKGLWSRGPHSDFFLKKVTSLCRGGVLVEFGCAEGLLANELPDGVFSSYYGFDVSEVAVKIAREQVFTHRASCCTFDQCDMSSWKGASGISLVLLEECLCYLSISDTKKFLEVCKRSLVQGGAILVVDHSAEKHAASLSVCRSVCSVVEEVVVGGRTYLTLN